MIQIALSISIIYIVRHLNYIDETLILHHDRIQEQVEKLKSNNKEEEILPELISEEDEDQDPIYL
ncbi:MAG TPA: hypothetical protein VI423_10370 [Paenisporosarcina sp.]|nr:hypothetical protein [Paenisporosarcina sp.]